jgi:hypothetical protein
MPPKMGEGSPQQTRQESHQVSAQETSANPEVPQGSDTRWDIDKAETVGRATYEAAATEAERKYRGNPFDSFPLNVPFTSDEEPEGLEEVKGWRMEKELIEIRQRRAEESNTRIAELQQPYERFYDLDPQRFSQMPLPEFMSLSQEFSGLELRLSKAQEIINNMKDLSSLLEKHLVQKRRFDGDFLRYLIDIVKYFNGFPERESIFSTQKEIYSIIRDFDNSPRQIIEKYKQIVERFIPAAEMYLESRKREYEEFLTKHGLSERAQVAPTA